MAQDKNYLVVFAGPVEGKEEAFQQWYNEVHVPDILSLPGYSGAQRFEFVAPHAGEPPQRFLAIYEVEGSIEAGKAAMAEGRASQRIRMSDALDPNSVATPATDDLLAILARNAPFSFEEIKSFSGGKRRKRCVVV